MASSTVCVGGDRFRHVEQQGDVGELVSTVRSGAALPFRDDDAPPRRERCALEVEAVDRDPARIGEEETGQDAEGVDLPAPFGPEATTRRVPHAA